MPTITDWLMVGITAIYVIATIAICWANIRSAKATREQVAESKRQFEETRRLEIMPYLQFESGIGLTDYTLKLELMSGDSDGGSYSEKILVKNIGRGTARDITGVWNCFNGSRIINNLPFKAIQSGEKQLLVIDFVLPKDEPDVSNASIELKFRDLLNIAYTQTIQFEFKCYLGKLTLKNYSITAPELIKNIQEGSNV